MDPMMGQNFFGHAPNLFAQSNGLSTPGTSSLGSNNMNGLMQQLMQKFKVPPGPGAPDAQGRGPDNPYYQDPNLQGNIFQRAVKDLTALPGNITRGIVGGIESVAKLPMSIYHMGQDVANMGQNGGFTGGGGQKLLQDFEQTPSGMFAKSMGGTVMRSPIAGLAHAGYDLATGHPEKGMGDMFAGAEAQLHAPFSVGMQDVTNAASIAAPIAGGEGGVFSQSLEGAARSAGATGETGALTAAEDAGGAAKVASTASNVVSNASRPLSSVHNLFSNMADTGHAGFKPPMGYDPAAAEAADVKAASPASRTAAQGPTVGTEDANISVASKASTPANPLGAPIGDAQKATEAAVNNLSGEAPNRFTGMTDPNAPIKENVNTFNESQPKTPDIQGVTDQAALDASGKVLDQAGLPEGARPANRFEVGAAHLQDAFQQLKASGQKFLGDLNPKWTPEGRAAVKAQQGLASDTNALRQDFNQAGSEQGVNNQIEKYAIGQVAAQQSLDDGVRQGAALKAVKSQFDTMSDTGKAQFLRDLRERTPDAYNQLDPLFKEGWALHEANLTDPNFGKTIGYVDRGLADYSFDKTGDTTAFARTMQKYANNPDQFGTVPLAAKLGAESGLTSEPHFMNAAVHEAEARDAEDFAGTMQGRTDEIGQNALANSSLMRQQAELDKQAYADHFNKDIHSDPRFEPFANALHQHHKFTAGNKLPEDLPYAQKLNIEPHVAANLDSVHFMPEAHLENAASSFTQAVAAHGGNVQAALDAGALRDVPDSAKSLPVIQHAVTGNVDRMIRAGINPNDIEFLKEIPTTLDAMNKAGIKTYYYKSLPDQLPHNVALDSKMGRTILGEGKDDPILHGYDALGTNNSWAVIAHSHFEAAKQVIRDQYKEKLMQTVGKTKNEVLQNVPDLASKSLAQEYGERWKNNPVAAAEYIRQNFVGHSRMPLSTENIMRAGAEDKLFLSKNVANMLDRAEARSGGVEKWFENYFDPVMHAWKVAHTAFSPSWHVKMAIGNEILASIVGHVSPVDLISGVRPGGYITKLTKSLKESPGGHLAPAVRESLMKDYPVLGVLDQQFSKVGYDWLDEPIIKDLLNSGLVHDLESDPASHLGQQLQRNALGRAISDNPLTKGVQKLSQASMRSARSVNDMVRTSVYVDYLRKALAAGKITPETAASEVEHAIQRTNIALGRFNEMSGFESKVLKRFVTPFYAWYRHMARVSVEMLKPENLGRTAMMTSIANIYGQNNDPNQPQMPEWMRDSVHFFGLYYDGKKGGLFPFSTNPHSGPPVMLNADTLNPFSDIMGSSDMVNPEGQLTPGQGLRSMLGPIPQVLGSTMFQTNVKTGQPISSPGPFSKLSLGTALQNTFKQTPLIKDLWRQYVSQQPLDRYGTGAIRGKPQFEQERNALFDVSNYFGLPIQPVNPSDPYQVAQKDQRAEKLAQHYQQKVATMVNQWPNKNQY